ncbi:DNA-binding protein [Nonomuraea sp. CA-143628]|uniref:DNA-binding protein n=1 Tax=Nonomuraea sp. CA-143628 TaxID=3239997 RepID=UPI003D8A3B65
MTEEQVRALPVAVPLVTAGQALLMGRTKSHELARKGAFPCKVLRLGAAYVVPKAALLDLLGLADDSLASGAPAASSTTAGPPVATG